MEFEWDPKKAERNKRKHDVTFHEAATVFGNPDHFEDEERYLTFGQSLFDRLLIVCHTARGNRIRIINARLMTRQERRIYEEG